VRRLPIALRIVSQAGSIPQPTLPAARHASYALTAENPINKPGPVVIPMGSTSIVVGLE
jgi:hypothetical protein